jgi:nicotinamide mononucleotide transporter
MTVLSWIQDHLIEIFGAVTGIIYVFLEIKQNIWLWPVGIVTSAVYIWVFFTHKFYADMSLQCYYLLISVLGWYWWLGKGSKQPVGPKADKELQVTRINLRQIMALALVFIILYGVMWLVLSRLTDSPVPGWDSFITSLSIVATWMLARKIYEHWYLWIVVNTASAVIFFVKGLQPTVILYIVYGVMSFAGLIEWRKSMNSSCALDL